MTGKYFYVSQVAPAAPQASDMEIASKLWDVSAQMVHLLEGQRIAA